MSSTTLASTDKRQVRLGKLAAEVLVVVCDNPAEAYAHAITKKLNERLGAKYTNNLEVGEALMLLSQDDALEALDPVRGPNSTVPRKMYKPTWKAGLYLGLRQSSTSVAAAA
jgi:hypothetical protein